MSNPNFFSDPGTTTTIKAVLASTINNTVTNIPLVDASNLPEKGKIQIGSEVITYSGKTNNILNNCYRANPLSHSPPAIVTLLARDSEAPIGTSQVHSGWYKERGSSDKTLRISDSNLMMTGAIRFNEKTTNFQGFNGTDWVTFNAQKGATGDPGNNASELFNFVNLPPGLSGTEIGQVFKESDDTTVYLRSIQSGTYDLTSSITGVQAIQINNDSNYITLTPQPRPYVWDFTSLNLINDLKGDVDGKLKAFGTVSRWKVKTGKTVQKGYAVRVALDLVNSQLTIEPYTYTSLTDFVNTSQEGLGFLGIALENKSSGESCEVCTEGITTAILGNNSPFTTRTSTDGAGHYGFVSKEGKIFIPNPLTSITIAPIAGYWLQKGDIGYNNLGLFYVKGGLAI
jgi:hypothetical protein